MKKRKPRWTDGYRYLTIRIVKVERIREDDEFGFGKYIETFVIDETDYYHDKYGNKEFTLEVECMYPSKVGRIIRFPFSMDKSE